MTHLRLLRELKKYMSYRWSRRRNRLGKKKGFNIMSTILWKIVEVLIQILLTDLWLAILRKIRIKNKGDKVGIGEKGLDDQFQKDKEKERAKHEAEAKNKGAGKAGSSTDVPGRTRSGSNNPVRTPPYKRKAGEPDSPATIERLAKSHWHKFATKMKKKVGANYPRRFLNIRGVDHFELDDFIFGLTFQPEEYSPVLQHQSNGNLLYIDVQPYDGKWLPKDINKKDISPSRRISFNPVMAWVEDRWILVRRFAGDQFCQVIFYYVSTFVWKKNDLTSKQTYNRQEALLKEVFQIEDTESWREEHLRQDSTIPVITWKGDAIVHLTRTLINKIVSETCLLGPVAAMYGREFQQFLLVKGDRATIPVAEMQHSIDSGRASLSDGKIKALHTECLNKNTWGKTSPERTRTRTPSRDKGTRGQAPWKDNRRSSPPWKDNRRSSHPAYSREDPIRSDYDARYMDIRYNPKYQRLQQQKENQKEIQRLQQEQDHLRQQERIRDRQERARRAQQQHRDSSRSEGRRNSRSSYYGERPRGPRHSDYHPPRVPRRRSFHKEDYRPRRYD